ncbi:MAG: glycosyltransferase family 39 protein [bacterium]|nr:glycosyltransferase family 39 protein [bacterium]
MNTIINQYARSLVFLWGVLLFIPFLGSVHLFDWDEINFAESAREMLVSGNYQKVQINFQPFMEKPPLFFWLQALSMKIFGVNEFAARFPNALIGIITLLVIFEIGRKWFNTKFALLWVLMVTGSLTPHLYFKTGIIDPLYNLFIFSAIYQLFLYTQNKQAKHASLLGVFLGFAIITKGPVAVVVLVLSFLVYWALHRFKPFFNWLHLLYAAGFALLLSVFWFGVETVENGPVFLVEFFKYQADLFLNPVAGHGQPVWYHPLVLLLGCFPASIIALPILFKRWEVNENNAQSGLLRMMRLFFWVVLILFSIVETKIVHYSSLCYLPLTFMAAHFICCWQKAKVKLTAVQLVLFPLVGLILSFLLIAIPLVDWFKPKLYPLIKDDFAKASLQVSGEWMGYESLLGAALLVMVLVSFVLFLRKHVYQSTRNFLLFHSVLIPALLLTLAPHVEKYSQAPAIEFFEQLQGKPVYVETLGYKSYAQYFYARTPQHERAEAYDMHWLLTGPIDRDAYFSLHVNNVNDHINPSMHEIGRKGGFVFYKRSAVLDSLESVIKP